MDDFNNSKTPCGAKGFDMSGFYRLKKKEISDRRRADDQLIMKPFFFLCLKEKVRLSLRMDQSRHLIPLYKHEQVFF